MKQKLLFLIFILVSFLNTINAQTPCGITELTACDDNDDGLAIFDLTVLDDIYPFCMVDASASDYNQPTHHLTQADADTGANPIANPEVYESTNGQAIFMRAEPLNSSTHDVLVFETYELVVHCPDPSFFLMPSCNGALVTILGDFGGTFSFDPVPTDGASIDPITGIITEGIPGETYCVTYAFSGTTTVSSTECVTLLLSDDSSFFMTPTCDGGTATITGTPGGAFIFNPDPGDGAVIDPATGSVTGATIGAIYSVEYTTNGACSSSFIVAFVAGCDDYVGILDINAFLDENSNMIFDDSEVNYGRGEFTYELNNDGIVHSVVSNSGRFLLSVAEEGDTYDVGFTIFDEYNSCLNQTITLVEDATATNSETVRIDFPLVPIGECNDIGVYLISNVSPRPGVPNNNVLVVKNYGTIPISGTVEFTHDDILSLIEVFGVESGNSITNTTSGFILEFNDLLPGYLEYITIRLDVPTTANSGDIVTNSVTYNVDDLNLDNNESILTQIVVNSYDPNDKMESHGPKIVWDDFTSNDYLYYTIRFQNLGTAEAIDIRIEDVLDSQLDASTFKMLHASHDYVLTRTDNNLTWQFDDIELPSESMDEPNSHGYVYFKIKPMSGYALGDVIPNYADIYFDFNPAVTTNTFETTFVNNLSISEYDNTTFSIYPNPTNDIINIVSKSETNDFTVEIFDVVGKLVMKKRINGNSLNLSQLNAGAYLLKISCCDSMKKTFKLIKK